MKIENKKTGERFKEHLPIHKRNFPCTILRLYQAYGPKQDLNRFIPILIFSCLKDIKFPEDSIVGVINHHGQLSIARGESQLSDEDTVLVFAKSNVVSKLRKLFES